MRNGGDMRSRRRSPSPVSQTGLTPVALGRLGLATSFVILGACGDGGGSATAPPPSASTGALEISAFTTGVDTDSDGYELTVVGGGVTRTTTLGREPGAGVRPKSEDAITFSRVSVGEYEIRLADVAGNCQLTVSDTRTLSVTAGGTARTGFEIVCSPIPPLIDKVLFESFRDGPFSIYHMNPAGTDVTRLTFPQGAIDTHADISPDGKRITMTRETSDGASIFIVNADGGDEYELAENAMMPSWSPDGTRIAYTGAPGAPDAFEILVMDSDGTNRRVLSPDPENDQWPDWSPDGSQIVFMRDFDIWVMGADGTGPRSLATNLGAFNPRWSPDGTRIALNTARPDGNWEAYVINVDGSGLTNLTNHPADDFAGPWSPDGTRMLMSTFRHDTPPSNQGIYVMNSDGTGLVRLTDDPAWDAPTSWSR